MKKGLLFFFLLFLQSVLALPVLAEDWALVVLQTDGNRSTFLLSDKPEVTFSGADCVFSSEKATVSIPRANIAGFQFEKAPAGIDNLKNDDTLFRFIGKGVVCIVNVTSSDIQVYDLLGNRMNADISADGRNTVVSLEPLPDGLYVICYAGNAIKVKR